MRPWISQRIERERERRGENRRIPLYIEPSTPSRAGEDRPERRPDEPRGWCVIDDTLDTAIDTL
ncbi:MAG: hypothetical protein ABIO70_23715 [Pseudomonadota bacterium]